MRNKAITLDDYILKFDEINQIANDFEGSLDDLLDQAYELFYGAYADGYEAVTGDEIKAPDIEALIFFEYDGKDSFDRLEEAYADDDKPRITKIFETEYHRIYNNGMLDGAIESGKTKKTWRTVLDDKVRDNHAWLEGVTLPIEAEFNTPDGDKGLFPGGFESAENNANCRCVLSFT